MDNSKPTVAETATPTTLPEAAVSPVKITPLLKWSLVALIVLILLVVITSFISKPKPPLSALLSTPEPSQVASASGELRPVSSFGQTPEFAQFEERLNSYRGSLDTLDLNESQLTFPLLDMDVNFTP